MVTVACAGHGRDDRSAPCQRRRSRKRQLNQSFIWLHDSRDSNRRSEDHRLGDFRRLQAKPSESKLNPSQTKPNARKMQGINLVFACISLANRDFSMGYERCASRLGRLVAQGATRFCAVPGSSPDGGKRRFMSCRHESVSGAFCIMKITIALFAVFRKEFVVTHAPSAAPFCRRPRGQSTARGLGRSLAE